LACASDEDNNNTEIDNESLGTWIGVSSIFNEQNLSVPNNSIVKFTVDNRTEFVYEGKGLVIMGKIFTCKKIGQKVEAL